MKLSISRLAAVAEIGMKEPWICASARLDATQRMVDFLSEDGTVHEGMTDWQIRKAIQELWIKTDDRMLDIDCRMALRDERTVQRLSDGLTPFFGAWDE